MTSLAIKAPSDPGKPVEPSNSTLDSSLMKRVNELMRALVDRLGPYTGYCVGPALSIVGATVVRLSLGKRAPTSSPFYLAVFVGVALLVTYLANWFFKQYQPQIKAKGVVGALAQAVTPSPQKIVPYHTCFWTVDEFKSRLPRFESLSSDPISEQEAKQEWAIFQYQLAQCAKKPQDSIAGNLKASFVNALKSAVLSKTPGLVQEIMGTISQNSTFGCYIKKDELDRIYYHFGFRLARFIQEAALASMFNWVGHFDRRSAIMDALIIGDTAQADGLTRGAERGENLHELFIYGGAQDPVLGEFKLPPKSVRLMVAAVLHGNVEYVKLLVQGASDPDSFDWNQKDSKNNSLLCIAAASGSIEMWDFINSHLELPSKDDPEYLRLLYASIQGGSLEIFKKLVGVFLEEQEHQSQRCGSLIVELYKKAISLGVDTIISDLKSNSFLNQELQKQRSYYEFVIASILGNQQELFEFYKKLWIQEEGKNVEEFQQLYQAILSSPDPCIKALTAVQLVERKYLSSQTPLPIECSAGGMLALFKNQEWGKFLINRMEPTNLHEMLMSNQQCLIAIIQSEELLSFVLDKCADIGSKLGYKIGKQAIILTRSSTIRVLTQKELNFTIRVEELDGSLLSFAVFRAVATLNFDFIEAVFNLLPPLPASILAALESHLKHNLKFGSYEQICDQIVGLIARKQHTAVSGAPDDLSLVSSSRKSWFW